MLPTNNYKIYGSILSSSNLILSKMLLWYKPPPPFLESPGVWRPFNPTGTGVGAFFAVYFLKMPLSETSWQVLTFVRRYVKIFWINPLQGHFLVIDHQDPSPLFNKVKRQRVSLFPPKNIVLDNRELKSKCFSLLLESPAQSFDIRYILVGIHNI